MDEQRQVADFIAQHDLEKYERRLVEGGSPGSSADANGNEDAE